MQITNIKKITAMALLCNALILATPVTLLAQRAIEVTNSGANQSSDRDSESDQNEESYQNSEGTTFKPKVGRHAVEKYMNHGRKQAAGANGSRQPASLRQQSTNDSHYLAIHVGSFVSDTAYKWGSDTPSNNVGRINTGLTYRVGEWINSMDLAIRIDYSQFSFGQEKANKLSFLPIVMFPDANSKFPLFFGAGAGIGIFMNQIKRESAMSLDYQLVAGARFLDIFDHTGLFVEGGLKNHLFMFSDGQFNGAFLSLGSVFSF
jgi:hypothetical protein